MRATPEAITAAPGQPGITVTLSRRNLTTLLKQLDENPGKALLPGLSARDKGIEIVVIPQEDEDHYGDQPAGVMSWERHGE